MCTEERKKPPAGGFSPMRAYLRTLDDAFEQKLINFGLIAILF